MILKYQDIESLIENWDLFDFSLPTLITEHAPTDSKKPEQLLVGLLSLSRPRDDRTTSDNFTSLSDGDHAPSPLNFTISPFHLPRGTSYATFLIAFSFLKRREVHVAFKCMFTIGTDEEQCTQVCKVWIDLELLKLSSFCNRRGYADHTSFISECKKDLPAKFCGISLRILIFSLLHDPARLTSSHPQNLDGYNQRYNKLPMVTVLRGSWKLCTLLV